jgi:hypothetical protein
MTPKKDAATMSLKIFRDRLQEWQELSREPGLTALLVVQVSLIFIVTPLAGMGVIP